MKKNQLILSVLGLSLVLVLFFWGNTTPPPENDMKVAQSQQSADSVVTINTLLSTAKKELNTSQSAKIAVLENSVVRGDVKDQKLHQYHQLASFWGDSLSRQDIAAYYMSEASKLENSEKSLNFAARLFFNLMMSEQNESLQKWEATNATDLYNKVLVLDPANDSAKVELGACYLFGNISESPMTGILKIKEVADKDTNNMYAQLLLGLGDIKSMQYDKAIERLTKVVDHEPDNLQALFNLAETYERKGDKANAVLWYRKVEQIISNPDAKKEIESRINSLQ